MNLQQYINENPTATLSDVQALTLSVERMITPDMAVSILTETDSVLLLQESAKTDPKAAGFLLALNGSVTEFNVMNSHSVGVKQQLLLTYLVAVNAITENCKLALISYANYDEQIFKNTTQSQFNSIKGLFKEVEVIHTAGKDLVITLNADLTERVAATVWHKETGFADENIGRNVHIQAAQKYRINMKGIASGTYQVRMPLLDADFTVESV